MYSLARNGFFTKRSWFSFVKSRTLIPDTRLTHGSIVSDICPLYLSIWRHLGYLNNLRMSLTFYPIMAGNALTPLEKGLGSVAHYA